MTSANCMSILKGCAKWRDARWTHALRNWGGHAAATIVRLKAVAPYALIELVLPGGSVMALLLWLYRRGRCGAAPADGLGSNESRLAAKRRGGNMLQVSFSVPDTSRIGHDPQVTGGKCSTILLNSSYI
jgi:hypothetical protein